MSKTFKKWQNKIPIISNFLQLHEIVLLIGLHNSLYSSIFLRSTTVYSCTSWLQFRSFIIADAKSYSFLNTLNILGVYTCDACFDKGEFFKHKGGNFSLELYSASNSLSHMLYSASNSLSSFAPLLSQSAKKICLCPNLISSNLSNPDSNFH